MQEAPLPPDENERLKALYKYKILDTEAEEIFDDIVELASRICGTPISLISLIDTDRQWFKAKVGLDAGETHRSLAFCAHAICNDQILEIKNAKEDQRFADNPLVTDNPHIRFYAGAPLITTDGFRLGTLCTIDTEPKELSEDQRKGLEALARQVGVNLDLRLRTQMLKELNEEKNRFFSVLAHDLRSPVKNIVALCEMLDLCIDEMSLESIRERARHIGATADKADKLIHDLLEWAQFDRGEMRFEPKKVQLHGLVENVVELLGELAKRKGIELTHDCNDELNAFADPTMLHSIVQNLVSNALKFTDEGGRVAVSCEEKDDMVCIDVEDTGVGMSEKAIESVMAIDKSYSTEGTMGEQGSGLGLALCSRFANRMGGSVSIRSESGKGTTVSVELPISESS